MKPSVYEVSELARLTRAIAGIVETLELESESSMGGVLNSIQTARFHHLTARAQHMLKLLVEDERMVEDEGD
jgi:hypothetical protein